MRVNKMLQLEFLPTATCRKWLKACSAHLEARERLETIDGPALQKQEGWHTFRVVEFNT